MSTSEGRPTAQLLWAATVRNRPLEDRVAVARAAGLREQSVFPDHVTAWLEKGSTLAEIRDSARAGGAPITILDPLTRWLPGWRLPAWMNAAERAFQITDEETFFGYAAELEVTDISVIDGIGQRNDLAEVVAAFQRVCDRARELDIRVALEFMPFGSIPDLATGWEVVRRAARDNGGLVFDTYHYQRGYPQPGMLAQVPGEKIYSVQISDAAAAVQGGSLYADQMNHREAPGDGELDLVDLTRRLAAVGALDRFGLELFSARADELAPAELGALLTETTDRLLAAL